MAETELYPSSEFRPRFIGLVLGQEFGQPANSVTVTVIPVAYHKSRKFRPMPNPELPRNAKDVCAYIVDKAVGFKESEEFQVNWDGDCKEFTELLVLGCSSFGRFVSRIVAEAMEKPERRAALKPVVDSAFDVIEMLSNIDDDYIDTCVTTGLFEALDDVPSIAIWSTIVSRLGPKSRATWDYYIPGVSRRQFRPESVVDLDEGID